MYLKVSQPKSRGQGPAPIRRKVLLLFFPKVYSCCSHARAVQCDEYTLFSPKKQHLSQCKGFSLIEMLVVIALTTIVTLAVANIISTFYSYNAYTVAQTSELSEARRGMHRMIRDLREMTFADNGQFPLNNFATTSILFFSDIDRDESVELVEFELIGTTLYKYIYDAVGTTYSTSTPDQTEVLSYYVQNGIESTPIFRYYNVDGSETTSIADIADVRYITVDLIINVDPIRNPGEFTLRSSAALRNLIETY